METLMDISKETIAEFCGRWGIAEFALFGSVLRDDFGPDSDIDVLVKFDPEAAHSLFDLVRMEDELSELIGRKVDIVSRGGIEASRNPLRRDAILASAKVIYAA
ncbi:MAG TPA: nucleotidyltransferase [Desulfofustis sp.]|jgi:predicted nucleotidyltransferase|nr:nucleotidyltransferase [Desulfofustis sp.]